MQASEIVAAGCLAVRTRMLARRVTSLYDGALRPHGITVAQLGLLVGIDRQPGIAAADLGRAFELEKSTLSRNLARMVGAGWIEPEELRLTAAGRALVGRAFPAWRKAQARAEALLGEDGRAAIFTLAAKARRSPR